MKVLEDVKVLEQFVSWQGEGENQGKRAVFYRFAGCNLRCHWCDTKYSWRVNQGELSSAVIPDDIGQYFLVVVTGGEPLIEGNRGMVSRLLSELNEIGWRGEVEVETNGTCLPLQGVYQFKLKYVVSPKPYGTVWEGWERLEHVDRVWKFVVGEETEEFVERWLNRLGRRERVWLMPMGSSVEEIGKNVGRVVSLAQRYNVNVSGRLHVMFGIAKKERGWGI